MSDPVKPWTNRLLETAVTVLVAAFMLSWAWALLKPLVPGLVVVLAGIVATVSTFSYLIHRRRNW